MESGNLFQTRINSNQVLPQFIRTNSLTIGQVNPHSAVGNWLEKSLLQQAVGGRPPQYAPPSSPSVGAEAPRAAEPTAPDRNVAVGSHGQYVPTLTAA